MSKPMTGILLATFITTCIENFLHATDREHDRYLVECAPILKGASQASFRKNGWSLQSPLHHAHENRYHIEPVVVNLFSKRFEAKCKTVEEPTDRFLQSSRYIRELIAFIAPSAFKVLQSTETTTYLQDKKIRDD